MRGHEVVTSYSGFKPSSFLSFGPSLNASIHLLGLHRALRLPKQIKLATELGIQGGPLKKVHEMCKRHVKSSFWARPKSPKTYRNPVPCLPSPVSGSKVTHSCFMLCLSNQSGLWTRDPIWSRIESGDLGRENATGRDKGEFSSPFYFDFFQQGEGKLSYSMQREDWGMGQEVGHSHSLTVW